MTKNRLIRTVYILSGFFFVGLGIIGMFLPLMPTTIFLIIASFFFARSSERLNEKLLNNKVFGKLIADFYEERAMPLKAKITAIILLNSALAYSIFFAANHLYLQLVLFLTGVFVTLYLLSLKTKTAG